MKSTVGTNFYTQSTINPDVWIKFSNELGFADECELRNTSTLPMDENLFSKGCTIKVENNASQAINMGNDGEVPSWVITGDNSSDLSIPVFLGLLISVDMNSIVDQPLTITAQGSTFGIYSVLVRNASVSMTTVDDLQIWTGAGRTGLKLWAMGNGTTTISPGFALLTNSIKFIEQILLSNPAGESFTTSTVYLSFGTPQGSAATADFYINGFVFN